MKHIEVQRALEAQEISMELKSDMWVDIYRPETPSDMVLTKLNRDLIGKFKKKNSIPNLVLIGNPGIGKSTLAKILVRDVLNCTYLYINASDETGVDTIRHKVVNFANTFSFDGKIKVVILDECLEENTLVWVLRNGKIIRCKIKALLQDTDLVKSYNTNSKEIVWRPFKLIDQGVQKLFEFKFENGEVVQCTENHKWYVEHKGITTIMKVKDIISNKIDHILTPE